MSTTTLFVELLIVGLEACTWLTLLIGALFGFDWLLAFVSAFEKAEAFTTAVLLCFAYLVGIVVEEVSDWLIKPWASRIRIRALKQKTGQPESYDMQAYVYSHSSEATKQLDYMRSRRRILRASIFNIAMISVFALITTWTRASISNDLRTGFTWFICLAGLMAVGLTAFAYRRVHVDYLSAVQQTYQSLVKENEEVKGMSNARAKKNNG